MAQQFPINAALCCCAYIVIYISHIKFLCCQYFACRTNSWSFRFGQPVCKSFGWHFVSISIFFSAVVVCLFFLLSASKINVFEKHFIHHLHKHAVTVNTTNSALSATSLLHEQNTQLDYVCVCVCVYKLRIHT